VYSSAEGYADASRSLRRFGAASVARNLSLRVGRPPRWLFRARSRLFAINPFRGGSLPDWLAGGSDPSFRLPRGLLDASWYTTFILALGSLPLDFRRLDAAMDSEAVLTDAVLLVAADMQANAIAKQELRGLFLQRSDGKWVKTPDFGIIAPTVSSSYDAVALRDDVAAAETSLQRWTSAAQQSLRADWALKALLADDAWSRFISLVFSLEQLIAEHRRRRPVPAGDPRRVTAESFYATAGPGAMLTGKRRVAITLRFALVAADLSPSTGLTDTATFYRVKKVRDTLLHGKSTEAPDAATVSAARELTLRYNKLLSLA
jgi:hypothetical protein